MKVISAQKFKLDCLAVIEMADSTGESVTITKRGKPVAKLEPVAKPITDACGLFIGRVNIVGDVVSPALTKKEWGNLA
jgi:prevent-host-death family protein